jgi:hypothetical protein
MLLDTPTGPTAVEILKEGDLVVTPDGREVPIVRVIKTVVRGEYETIPYRIPKDFFQKDYPSADILISPNHMLYWNEWTVPTRITGLPEERERMGKEIEYYHVALPDYGGDKLMCQGIAVDSWDMSVKLVI